MTAGNRIAAAALAATAWLAGGWGFDTETLKAQPPEGLAQPAENSTQPAEGFDRQALVEAAIEARADGRFERLDGYLRFLAPRLDFYFTIEEGPRQFFSPGIADRSATTLPVDVATVKLALALWFRNSTTTDLVPGPLFS
jgi:hypothetical protein